MGALSPFRPAASGVLGVGPASDLGYLLRLQDRILCHLTDRICSITVLLPRSDLWCGPPPPPRSSSPPSAAETAVSDSRGEAVLRPCTSGNSSFPIVTFRTHFYASLLWASTPGRRCVYLKT